VQFIIIHVTIKHWFFEIYLIWSEFMLFRIPYVTGFCIFVRTKSVLYLVPKCQKSIYQDKKKKKTRFCSLKIPEYSKKLTNPQYGKSYKTLLCGIQSHLTSHSHKKLQAPKGNKLQATQVNSKFCQWHLPTLKSFLLLTNFTPKADCTHDLNSMISIL
jgi:hypothetical protein